MTAFYIITFLATTKIPYKLPHDSTNFLLFPFYSSAPPANGFSQMARMMDSLILDSLSSTPFAFTKITTHRPVKKATSTNHLPSNGSSSTSTGNRNATFLNQKKIPTQGRFIYQILPLFSKKCKERVLHILSWRSPKRTHNSANALFASSQVCLLRFTSTPAITGRGHFQRTRMKNFLTTREHTTENSWKKIQVIYFLSHGSNRVSFPESGK